MFYVLNFANHQFVSCDTISKTVATIGGFLWAGINKDDIEIINGFADDSRLSVEELLNKYAGEEKE